MAKLRINGDSSGYVDLEAPNAASSSTLDLDQVPQKNATTKFDTVLQVGSSSTITNAYGAASGYVFDIKANSGTQSYMSIGMPSDTLGSTGLVMGVDTSAVRITSRDDKRQIFSTNNIERMAIHSTTSGDGAVTMPHQPVFMARKSSTQNIVNSDKITFENAIANAGTHYNTTNSRFTAPVAGNYSFSINLRCGIESGARVLTIAIHKNGSVLYGRFAGTGGVNDDGSGSYDHPYISGTIILPLNANDYIEMYFGTENSFSGNGFIQNSDNSSYFMGHLIG
jgi:hypothetical protein